ncbi:GNAT family N-acetyltransferase [Yinghuangia seranimata]|uniref:GNAT family N-acetyltransferase n=1 Tax=Yinghuangia seranimata TaxID=408067 RepID=UPI00248B68CA|nr:GNAT family N-acetyltransferase [Yinghuangia seranimata]MDI2131586.1 GNAT family N-acetyltransferase [Yinghuangia seranimata]
METGAETATIARDWVMGWTASRMAAPPVAEPWGYTVDVGLATQITRHVLVDLDEALVRKFTDGPTAPGTWLKTFVLPEVLEPWLTPGWVFDSEGFMMTTPLEHTPVSTPDGYRLRLWTRGEVTRLLIAGPDGGFAARGQVAIPSPGAVAVFDQIETSPDHRRKGLGSLVMRTLGNAAVEAGTTDGVLGATTDGRALYEALGWTTRLPLTGVIRKDDA